MDLLLDVVYDTVRLIPFLFVTYLLLTYAEHKDEVGFHRLIRRYQYLGPALGAVLGDGSAVRLQRHGCLSLSGFFHIDRYADGGISVDER